MDEKKSEKVILKSVALFCSYLLIVAIVVWASDISFVVGADNSDSEPTMMSENDLTELASMFKNDPQKFATNFKFKIVKDEDSGKRYAVFTCDGKFNNKKVELETLKTKLKVRNDGLLTVKLGDNKKEMKIPLENLPDGVKGIEIDGESIVYVYNSGKEKEASGKLIVDSPGVYLKKVSGKAVIQGIDESKYGKVSISELKEGGEVKISVDDNLQKPAISYKGKTKLSVGNRELLPVDGKSEGSVTLYEKGGMLVSKSRIIDNDKKVALQANDDGFYYGNNNVVPSGYEKKHLYFEGSTLKGDVTGVNSLILSNNNQNDYLKTDIKALNDQNKPYNYKVAIGKKGSNKGAIKVKDGKIEATKEGVSTSVVDDDKSKKDDNKKDDNEKDDNKKDDKPDLPQVGDPGSRGNGDGKPGNSGKPGDPGTPGGGDPGGGGGDPGGGGFPSWLKWALIIGGGILAAMLLFGKKKKKHDGGSNEEVDDDGEEYMGKDNTTDIFGNITDGRDGNKTTHYNPQEPLNKERFCECNESGCFNCPGDNCFECSSTNSSSPLIVSSDENKTIEEGENQTDK